MRRINFLVFSCLFMFMVTSCGQKDFLDATITTDLTENTVFSDSSRTLAFLTDIYANIGFSVNVTRFGNGGLDAACDESEPHSSANISTSTLFATGTINAAIVSGDAWNNCYSNIRKVNKFIQKLPTTPMVYYMKPTLIAEARFLRAWYYFILVQHYGGVPLIGDTIYAMNDNIKMTRDTYEDCINYILSECDSAALNLNPIRLRTEYGRISKGACLALKSRVLLYAASPLYNGCDLFTGTKAHTLGLVGYPTYNLERWKLAADAAKAVMDLGAFSLLDTINPTNLNEMGYGFYSMFHLRYNNEEILAKMQGGNRDLEAAWQPPSRGGSQGGFPYQEFVDAFGMANGKPITDPTSGYNQNDPYKNRDPRFDNSVLHDSSFFIMRAATVPTRLDFYLDENNKGVTEDAVHAGTPTGYYVNKMVHRTTTANYVNGTDRCFPLMRYAEILLNYAEAQNEYAGPSKSVYDAIEAIRKRAGLSTYTLYPSLTQEQMRTIIHNERRIELSFEGHRFFDVRRWLEAADTQNKQMFGMEVKRVGKSVTYTPFKVRKHGFRDAMYFWPIPQSEVAKSVGDNVLVQNPEW